MIKCNNCNKFYSTKLIKNIITQEWGYVCPYCNIFVDSKVANKVNFNYNDCTKEAYNYYIKSEQWRIKRTEILKSRGKVCEVCGQNLTNIPAHVHHKTYNNLGDEHPNDLLIVCEDCHKAIHEELTKKLFQQKQRINKYIKNCQQKKSKRAAKTKKRTDKSICYKCIHKQRMLMPTFSKKYKYEIVCTIGHKWKKFDTNFKCKDFRELIKTKN